MKNYVIKLMLFFSIGLILTSFSSCVNVESDQEKIASIVQDQYLDIDQMRNNRSLSLDEAETVLWCYADTNSGEEISEDDLREAIWVVLECNEEVRELIYNIGEIEID